MSYIGCKNNFLQSYWEILECEEIKAIFTDNKKGISYYYYMVQYKKIKSWIFYIKNLSFKIISFILLKEFL